VKREDIIPIFEIHLSEFVKNPAVELNSSFLPQILLGVIVEDGLQLPAA
jgi:hypothetical protein